MIKDLDVVALTRALPEHGLVAGDMGTIVHVYDDGQAYEVEFVTFGGKTIAVATLPSAAVRAIAKQEIPHVRAVA
jgi:Domain of unknown function (DUF4926)